MIKRKIKNISISALAFVTMISPVLNSGNNTVLAASDEDNITLDLVSKSDVDVVLSLGNTTLDYSNFKTDLKSRLTNLGVDVNKVNIQAVETNSQNLQNAFAWTQDVPPSVGSISIANNGTSINMHGNTSYAGFTKIYTDVKSQGLKSQDMSFSYNIDYGDNYDGAGVLFNLTEVNSATKAINGYALMFGQDGYGHIYQLTNFSSGNEIITSHYTSGYNNPSNMGYNVSYIGKIAIGRSGNVTLTTKKDSVTLKDRYSGAIIGSVPLPTHFGWGFGFFGDHYSHGCDMIGQFILTNVSLAQTTAKEFVEVIRIPEWRNNSERVLVHVDEETVPNFDNSVALGEIIPRLSNENIHLITYGNSVNAVQFAKVLGMNNGNGANYTVTNSSQYYTAVENTAQYIKKLIEKDGKGGQNVLVGKPIEVNVSPSSLKTNTATTDFPQGRWKINHDYTYFDNNLGQASWANQYQKDLVMTFDKPGKYDVGFGNSYPAPRYIYAHRAPVADFISSFSSSGITRTVSYNDRSYDPDRETSADKGIKSREWKWRESNSSTWNSGQLTTITEGRYYIVQLRVQDEFGVWSSAVQKFVSTDASANILPIADFDLNTDKITRYETLKYDDTSYSPNGLPITSRTWTVTNSAGSVVYSSSVPLTSMSGLGLGQYKITLQVRNSIGATSEKFSRFVEIVKDSNAPEAIINPVTKDWTNSIYNISVEINDVGGSGFKNQQFVLNNSATFPSSGFSAVSTNNKFTVPVNNDGIYYLHIIATDNEGNVMKRTSGPYKLDKTAPGAPTITLNKTEWTAPIVNFTITDKGDGAGSGISDVQYRINNGAWKSYTKGSKVDIPEELDGVIPVEARVLDNVGNISTVTKVNAYIDDKDPIINSVVVDGTKLIVDAVDNESGLKNPGYRYYQKIEGKDNSFNIIKGGWINESVIDLPVDLSSTKYIYKVEVEDNNKHTVMSDEVAYVSAPIITKAEVKDGDFDNTYTFDFKNAIGSDVNVEVYRENELVALIKSGETKFVDANLDYERSYNYKFVAVSNFNGKSVKSLEVTTQITIGKPTLEISLDGGKNYYNTVFSDEFKVTGEISYRKGGTVSTSLFNSSKLIDNKNINLIPYVKNKWSLSGTQNNDNSTYKVEFDLVGFENMKDYKRSYDVNVTRVTPVVKTITNHADFYK